MKIKTFNEYMINNINNFIDVEIPEYMMQKIENSIDDIIRAKSTEKDHIIDNDEERKRWKHGMMGEAALSIVLGLDTTDLSAGHSYNYNRPDLKQFNIGIKTSDWGNFPVITKENTYPQIINIINDNRVWICGIADTNILNTYQSDSLIKSKKLRERNVKTGFYGFDYLEPISNISKFTR